MAYTVKKNGGKRAFLIYLLTKEQIIPTLLRRHSTFSSTSFSSSSSPFFLSHSFMNLVLFGKARLGSVGSRRRDGKNVGAREIQVGNVRVLSCELLFSADDGYGEMEGEVNV